jgi:hypothetical protein
LNLASLANASKYLFLFFFSSTDNSKYGCMNSGNCSNNLSLTQLVPDVETIDYIFVNFSVLRLKFGMSACLDSKTLHAQLRMENAL